MPIPPDYAERVYAGVLGKVIGVYLGRPFENWTHARIEEQLGEIGYYVNGHPALDAAKRHSPIVQTDDDISGTFTFVRALPDHGNRRDISPAQIGRTWLNYVVEERSTHWWGGTGLSTEHTAYLRLKDGMPAPRSGSAALNGTVLSEQIGAQIFIDGWAMVAPGDPELAVDLARKAASVSHDGEAIHAAQVVAAMEAAAFVESDTERLIGTAVSLIPADCVIARLIDDVRQWHAGEPDWRRTRAAIESRYGYDRYGGNCPVVPNHALIMLALLYGRDDFQRSLRIVNTSGWDTDCNSGNVGCLLGIKNGLDGIDAGPDWRGPVADRMYLSTADGGRAITDAVTEAQHIVTVGRALAGQPPEAPTNRPRFSFALPGSVQGFLPEGSATLDNVERHGAGGGRALAIRLGRLAPGRAARAITATFTPPEAVELTDESVLAAPWLHPGKYALLACPTLYPGQIVHARVEADRDNPGPVSCRLVTRHYDGRNKLTGGLLTGGQILHSRTGARMQDLTPDTLLRPGEDLVLQGRVEDTGGQPVAQVGIEVDAPQRITGTVYLDYLTWDGAPQVTLAAPAEGGAIWRRAWVQDVDRFEPDWRAAYRLTQNRGRGLLIQGTREWEDYEVTAQVRPEMIGAAGIAARVQGLRRYYALLLCDDHTARLVKVLDEETPLAEAPLRRRYGGGHELSMRVEGTTIQARIDGERLMTFEDARRPLTGGAVALVCEEGTLTSEWVEVRPLPDTGREVTGGRRRTARP